MIKKQLPILVFFLMLFIATSTKAGDLKPGLQYYNSSQYHRAEEYFRKITHSEPMNYSAKYMLAVSLVNLYRFDEAREIYKDVINNSNNERLASLSSKGLSNIAGFQPASSKGFKKSPERIAKQAIASSSAYKTDIYFNKKGSSIIVDNVIVNDRLVSKFILDTGATYTSISKAAASSLGISTKNAKKLKIMTGSGYLQAPLVKVSKIEVNGMVVNNVNVLIMDLPLHSNKNGKQVAGLLGLSFLENFKFAVNLTEGKLTLERN